MKLLFVYTNVNGTHLDSYAVGIHMIMSVAKRAGHDVNLIRILKLDDYHLIDKALENFNPDIVGFTAVSSQFSFIKDLCDIVKKQFPKIITVVGGVHPTLDPECVMESKNLDVAFRGDSEIPFLQFLEKIEAFQSWKDCDNISFDENGKCQKNKLRPLLTAEELEQLPHPDRTSFNYFETLEMVGLVPFHFTRGCPFTCSYCSNIGIAKVYGQTRYNIRQPSPEYSIQEIEQVLEKYPQIREKKYKIYFTDDVFGLNKKWRREFLKLYRERIKIPFKCLLRCDVVTEDTMQDLARGYCYQIMFGVESGDDHVRNTIMSRDMPEETIINAFKLAKKYKIRTKALNIIGVPGETKEMLLNTIRLNSIIKPDETGANIFYPYKGTPLGDESFKKGLVNIERYEDFSNERKQSVMNYSEEWLETLKYYHENWLKEIYPWYSLKHYSPKQFYKIKSSIKNIPLVGYLLKTIYNKLKNRSSEISSRNRINKVTQIKQA
jgi:anaerobic magnesium-protoporphyrin IX monomethyl ester cyclase